jgi:hypothetical protein
MAIERWGYFSPRHEEIISHVFMTMNSRSSTEVSRYGNVGRPRYIAVCGGKHMSQGVLDRRHTMLHDNSTLDLQDHPP